MVLQSSRVQVTWSATSPGLDPADLFAQASSLRGERELLLGHLKEASSGIFLHHHPQHLSFRTLLALYRIRLDFR